MKDMIFSGINHTAAAYYITRQTAGKRALVLVPEDEISDFAREIELFSGSPALEFPHFQSFGEEDLGFLENCFRRLCTLSQLVNRAEKQLVVASLQSLERLVPPPDILNAHIFHLKKGSCFERDRLLDALPLMGYTRRDKVEEPGEFSLRGDVCDIYPPFFKPCRLDIFDDEVEKIYLFDTATQLSVSETQDVLIYPLTEALAPGIRIKSELESGGSKTDPVLLLQQRFDLFYAPADCGSYLKPEVLFIVEQEAQESAVIEWRKEKKGNPLLNRQFTGNQQIRERTQASAVRLSTLAPGTGACGTMAFQSGTSYQGKIELLADDLRALHRNGFTVTITARTRNQMLRLHDLLSQQRIAVYEAESFSMIKPGITNLTIGSLREGFAASDDRMALITEAEVFGSRLEKFYAGEYRDFSPVSHFTEIREGDFVVHIQHGIGRYRGMILMDVGGEKKDMLVIEYAGNDKLYIPVENILNIQKYIGGGEVVLDKLGGARFGRVKKKAHEAAEKFARELVRLYAMRSTRKGYAFSADTVWQEQMEAGFPYPETQDQLRTLSEIKRDMQSDRPMDRLICGDVGFGKTEVAVRAAFKAAIEGKQVAVLAPTTILCLQHFRVFSERMAGFPLKLAVLSRLTDNRACAKILDDLAEGKIDLVIGTHRLLQKDIKFHDLGLLVVDEEQRFGVHHKELLKRFRETVDTITLTATPIPRTLNMSLSGLMHISMITTPPPDRRSVVTTVQKKDIPVIRQAIRNELARRGQVFVVHNRVQSIYATAEMIQRELPEARIRVGHGQVPKQELENLLLDFLQQKYDVLVATTIIESGIDFPNANTLIIDDAQNFGLSQLYQLRGRIGRSDRQAYAYLLYTDKELTPDAHERLKAIATHTALGSGFKIAMQDLELRGAGNLIGKEQSGHMEAVGLEMYSDMLRRAVADLKGEKPEEPPEAVVNLRVHAYIPDDYIQDQEQKVEIYKKLARITKVSEKEALRRECLDRFGKPPLAFEMLLQIVEFKCYCYAIGVRELKQEGEVLRLDFHPDARVNLENLQGFLKTHPQAIFLSGATPALVYKCKGKSKKDVLEVSEEILKCLS
ncbi:MAG: transcription-repair coupling factor [Candidatus Wallbacteria bacterium]|nr:transcription-repair coupling factor [Candidatus Wallbacteria bacterium]